MEYYDWDERAMNFTVAAYERGYSAQQIHNQLFANGYRRLRLVTVEQCLRLHGHDLPLTLPIYYPEANNGITWNEVAHTFTLSAYLAGYSADQITQQLIDGGYNVVLAQITASLHAHGFQDVRIA